MDRRVATRNVDSVDECGLSSGSCWVVPDFACMVGSDGVV